MLDKEKVPAIRLKGFTDAWEQRKLTDITEFFSGLTYTPNDVQEYGTLVLRSSNVRNGEIVDADNVYVDSSVVNSQNVKEGDIIVVVRNGSRSLIGKHAQIKSFMPNTVIGAFMTGIRSQCPSFINALLNTPHFDEEVAMNMGATINQITGYMFSKMEFTVPSIDEQNRIGTYFEHLDNLITLHQRKFEKLKNIKIAMIEKMFPKNGSNVPEIRFTGFTDAWKQHKLSEILVEYNERAEKNQGYEHVSLTKEGVVAKTERYDRDSLVTTDNKSYRITRVDDICYNPANLKFGVICRNRYKDAIFSPIYITFKVIEDFSPAFIEKLVTRETFIIQALKWQQGTVYERTSVSPHDLLRMQVLVPTIDEQIIIGRTLTNLDNLIILHQRKLEKMKNIKKACLEKMLV